MSEKIDEMATICDILQMAIRREEASYHFYMQAYERAVLRVEKELFYRLAQEELLHKQNLERQLEEANCRTFTDRALSAGDI
ncbi:MAG: ferritin family protein [bacterium]